jgi:hypothetical protein
MLEAFLERLDRVLTERPKNRHGARAVGPYPPSSRKSSSRFSTVSGSRLWLIIRNYPTQALLRPCRAKSVTQVTKRGASHHPGARELLQSRSFLFAVFEKLYLTEPLFRRFLALVWTAQVLSFARCDLVAFFHLFAHFTLAIFHEDVANSWMYLVRERCGLGQGACATTSWAFPAREPNAIKSAPRHIAVASSIKGYAPRAGGLRYGENKI